MKKRSGAAILFFLFGVVAMAQTVTVTSPTGASHWCMGDAHQITWTSSGVSGDVRLRLFKGGAVVGNIAFAVPYSSSPYNWVVGTVGSGVVTPGSDYQVGVRLASGAVFKSDMFEIRAAGSCGGSRPELSVAAGAQRLMDYRIEVTAPVMNFRIEIGTYFNAAWKTQADPPFKAYLVKEDGSTVVYECGSLSSQEVRPDEFTAKMLLSPGPATHIPNGYYRILIRSKQNTRGLSPRIHLAHPTRKVAVELPPSLINDRYSHRRINGAEERQPYSWEGSKPGLARAGSSFFYNWKGALASDQWQGFIYRSQIVFPVEQVDMAGKTLADAWVYFEPKASVAYNYGSPDHATNTFRPVPTSNGGGRIFALTGPWDGKCIDTPGTQIGELPATAAPYSLHIKDLVNGWLLRTKPNHGLIVGSRWEPFDPWEWANFQQIYWYKATLVMEFVQEL